MANFSFVSGVNYPVRQGLAYMDFRAHTHKVAGTVEEKATEEAAGVPAANASIAIVSAQAGTVTPLGAGFTDENGQFDIGIGNHSELVEVTAVIGDAKLQTLHVMPEAVS